MLTPRFDTPNFGQVWPKASMFLEDISDCKLNISVSQASLEQLYYLLYAKYGDRHIANPDVFQFKYKVFSTIFAYGPEWEKKLDIQDKLRNLTEDELRTGATAIFNQAANPSQAPGTEGTGELSYVDAQNVSKQKRSKIEAYQFLWDILDSDVTKLFVERFEQFFGKFAFPHHIAMYRNDIDIECGGDDYD